MLLSEYAHSKGYTFKEYETLKQNIINTAAAIIEDIKSMYITDNGIYHDASEIKILNNKQYELYPFILVELKKQGMEFIENNNLWRY